MSFIIDIQNALTEPEPALPDQKYIHKVINTVLNKFKDNAEMSVRIVDNNEITALNSRYRHKNKPTNVLSFPTELPDGISLEFELLGDLVIAAEVVKKEAALQNKTFAAHFTHMLIHGTLHLLGFDHQNDNEATIMEQEEINLLKQFNIDNPYMLKN